MRRCAKLVSTRRVKDCDAWLYAYILTRLAKLGSPVRAAPNLTVTAVYPRLSRALVLPKSQFETNAVIMSFPQAVIDLV